MWKLNKTLMNNQQVKELTTETRKYLTNMIMKTQNLRDTKKELLRGKFIAIITHLKKTKTLNQ